MKNQLNLWQLKKAVDDTIANEPYQVQEWIRVGGDGLTGAMSFVFEHSWVGTIADTGRQVFRAFPTYPSSDTTAEKNIVVMLPYDAAKGIPKKNSEMRLYDMNGNQIYKMWVNFVRTFTAGTSGVNENTIYKIECHGIILEG